MSFFLLLRMFLLLYCTIASYRGRSSKTFLFALWSDDCGQLNFCLSMCMQVGIVDWQGRLDFYKLLYKRRLHIKSERDKRAYLVHVLLNQRYCQRM